MFDRNAIQNMNRWMNKKNRKPLVLRGARQVGKTTLVKVFAKQFGTFLHLNLEDKRAADLFSVSSGMEDLMSAIHLYCNIPVGKGKTLLFIDEIQNSPEAVARLRFFYEEMPHVYVIAAGSLLESMLNKSIRFPVGRVEFLAIRPCSFPEFLNATGEKMLAESIDKMSLPVALHEKASHLFNRYTLIGGMPEIIAEYSESKDIVSLSGLFDSLLTSYKDDVVKYARNETMEHVIGLILQEGWKYAAQTISMTGFAGSAYKAREMGEAFRTLEKTMLLELCYPTSGAILPVHPETKRQPKLLWLDTGIVNYVAGIQSEVFGSPDIMDVWRGRVAEQVVAQELLTLDDRVTYRRSFWMRDKKGSDAEVDFIVQNGSRIIPVEVKSGHNARLKSLHSFMDIAPHHIAVRIWSKPFDVSMVKTGKGKEFRLISLPFYYISKLHEWVERG